jgi:hypothetical protein
MKVAHTVNHLSRIDNDPKSDNITENEAGKGDSCMEQNISRLIELAKAVKPTEEQNEEQRRSFVYGNTAFENPQISRELVDEVAEKLRA